MRFQADPTGAIAQRGLYRNWADCLAAEGVPGLWRGCAPTVCRALAINSVELGCYDMVKVMLIPYFAQVTPKKNLVESWCERGEARPLTL